MLERCNHKTRILISSGQSNLNERDSHLLVGFGCLGQSGLEEHHRRERVRGHPADIWRDYCEVGLPIHYVNSPE